MWGAELRVVRVGGTHAGRGSVSLPGYTVVGPVRITGLVSSLANIG